MAPSSGGHVGALVRSWRDARGLSQERLAARAGVSTRHLSFIETGRAAPGKDVLLALAGALEVPLRDQNQLLLAAGLAPRYATSRLDDAALAMVRRAVDHVLHQQEPFPAIVVDRLWNVVRLNQGAQRLLTTFLPPAMPPPLDVTAEELRIESYFPADDATERTLRAWA